MLLVAIEVLEEVVLPVIAKVLDDAGVAVAAAAAAVVTVVFVAHVASEEDSRMEARLLPLLPPTLKYDGVANEEPNLFGQYWRVRS